MAEKKSCPYCGQPFTTRVKNQTYCSQRCRWAAGNARVRARERATSLETFSCPWATGQIRGSALGADPVLGF